MSGRRSSGRGANRRNVRRPAVPEAPRAALRPARVAAVVLTLGVLIAGGGGAAYGLSALAERGFFDVRHVDISGNARIPEDKVLGRLGLPEGIRLYRVDLEAVSRSVLSHPWVERVSVRRSFPSTLHIRIWERTPRAVLTAADGDPGGPGAVMVDVEGMVLGRPDEAARDLPRLTGFAAVRRVAGDRVDPERVIRGLSVARAWHAPGALVDVADLHDPLLLVDGMRIRLGNRGGYDWRLDRLRQLGPELANLRGKQGAEVDLRYDDKVVARPL